MSTQKILVKLFEELNSLFQTPFKSWKEDMEIFLYKGCALGWKSSGTKGIMHFKDGNFMFEIKELKVTLNVQDFKRFFKRVNIKKGLMLKGNT